MLLCVSVIHASFLKVLVLLKNTGLGDFIWQTCWLPPVDRCHARPCFRCCEGVEAQDLASDLRDPLSVKIAMNVTVKIQLTKCFFLWQRHQDNSMSNTFFATLVAVCMSAAYLPCTRWVCRMFRTSGILSDAVGRSTWSAKLLRFLTANVPTSEPGLVYVLRDIWAGRKLRK